MKSTIAELFASVREGLGQSSAYICYFEQVVIAGHEWQGEVRVGATALGDMASITLVREGHRLHLATSGGTLPLAVDNLEKQVKECYLVKGVKV